MHNQAIRFNQAQRDILNVVSVLHTDEEIKELRKVLIQFMNNRLQAEMDKLWESGEMSDEKLEKLKEEHLRTPYKS